jgi:hypothetical protein
VREAPPTEETERGGGEEEERKSQDPRRLTNDSDYERKQVLTASILIYTHLRAQITGSRTAPTRPWKSSQLFYDTV